jgi:hypothetical protein
MTQPAVKRIKKASYWRLRISENDLLRLAKIMADLASSHEGEVAIKVVSGDGEDTLASADPSVFGSLEMPTRVGLVSISFGDTFSAEYGASVPPVVCKIMLKAGPSRPYGSGEASLDVIGSDSILVNGVFGELDRQLRAGQVWGGWFNRAQNSLSYCRNVWKLVAGSSPRGVREAT